MNKRPSCCDVRTASTISKSFRAEQQELLETREWRKEIVSERDQLRDRVEWLEEQLARQSPGLEEGSLTDTRGLHAAEELDVPHAPGTGDQAEIRVSGSGEQHQQELEDPRTQLEDDTHPPSTQSTIVDSLPVRTVNSTQENEGSHNNGLSPSPPGIVGASLSVFLSSAYALCQTLYVEPLGHVDI